MLPIPAGEITNAIIRRNHKTEPWVEFYHSPTFRYRRMAAYSGLSFTELMDLPYSAFKLIERDSWIDSFMSTESGRKTLKDLWRLQQTKADTSAIQEFNERR